LRKRLTNYPDQNLLSNLLEGIRFEADVELQAVLVPHLISLPKGFTSVRNELYRLQTLGWYRFFDHLPFWPIYLNGQGATARKLETRYRRTKRRSRRMARSTPTTAMMGSSVYMWTT